MKVLYILHSTGMGGATISFLNMVNEVKKYGVHPVIVIPKNHSRKPDEVFIRKAESLNVKIFEADITPLIYKGFPQLIHLRTFKNTLIWLLSLQYKKKKGILALEKIVTEEHPDIIHSNSGVVHEGWHVCKKYNIPHVWHLREYQDIDFGYKIFPSHTEFENMLSQSSVISITEDILRHFHQTKRPNAHVVYNGIFHEYESSYTEEKEPFFLICSRISPEKGHKDAIKAFIEFCNKNKNYKLKIAGAYNNKNPYIQDLNNMIIASGFSNRIEFLGFKDDVKPLMRIAKALIVASPNEGFGRMTAEACFCGCLVIGRNTAGTKEILDYTGGIQYDGTIKDLIQKMHAVANMETVNYSKIAVRAMEMARNKYSIESNGYRVFQIYESLMNTHI